MKFPARMRRAATVCARALRTAALAAGRVAVSAMAWFLLLSIGGAVAAVIGVFLIAGLGFAYIAAAFFSLCGAALIYRGLSNG